MGTFNVFCGNVFVFVFVVTNDIKFSPSVCYVHIKPAVIVPFAY